MGLGTLTSRSHSIDSNYSFDYPTNSSYYNPYLKPNLTYNPNNPFSIDPHKMYPDEYREFMSPEGYWDFYGKFSWIDDTSLMTEEEVDYIIVKRKEKIDAKKLKKLEKL
jgi:hypothetical protein